MSIEEDVERLLAPVVATVGVELVDVDHNGANLKVVVNRPGGVDTAALVEVNRLISPLLDQHDPVPGRYTLEVTSPGLERRLRRHGHYVAAIGEQVLIKLFPQREIRRIRGELIEVETDRVVLVAKEVDGIELSPPEERHVLLVDVSSARTVFEWGPTPKPGQSQNNKKAKKTRGKSHK